MLLAAVAYVPLLLTRAGEVAADTKQYLYLDPGRLLARAPSMWDPNVALGTVTHQNIGYLFPAGPFYWLFDSIGAPDWIAQRLWLGSILLAAGVGVLYLLRTLDVRGPGRIVAAAVYMLSPYSLQYAARLSILLLAWAALPWMIALMARALRDGGWRYPAAFAIVVQVAGSVNATALIFVLVAPALWIVHSVWVSREVPGRAAIRTVGRVALLTALTSAWWVAGLSLQSGYGLNVLKYSETIEAVATAGLSGEVLRGLGYWFFYGGDKLGPWIEGAIDYTQRRSLIAIGYGIPILAMLSAAFIRWRHRVYFIALIIVGVVIAVGAHPYDDPSPFGALFKAFGEGSTAGLALRSVGRAVPLVALGVAVLLGVGANLLVERLSARGWRRAGLAVCAGLCLLAALNLPALFTGRFFGDNLLRPETLPRYWTDAIATLDARSAATRILELPGSDFTNYRWGSTVEPITPGLTDRPYVARELIPYGSAPSADVVRALDRRFQLGTLDPAAVAPIARLMSVGDIVLREDLQVERYDLIRPLETMIVFGASPEGLGPLRPFGPVAADPGIVDGRALGLGADVTSPASVVTTRVRGTRPIVRAESGGPILLVSGDAEGLIDLAQVGLIQGSVPIRYSASMHGAELARATRGDAVLVVTDTNRKRAQRWDTTRESVGFTERAREPRLAPDTFDNQLDVFPGARSGTNTVVEQRRVQVAASSYGMQSRYLPSDRAARAFDGDTATAWRVGAFGPVIGQRIRAQFDRPVRTSQINLVQPLSGARDRYITKATMRFFDSSGRPVGEDVPVDLGAASRDPAGQTIQFAKRRFSRVEIVIDGDNIGPKPSYSREGPVGFAEVRVRDDRPGAVDRTVDEVVRMPTDMVKSRGARGVRRALAFVMTRLRTRLTAPNIAEEEAALTREFFVPSTRDFGIVGTARVAASASDAVIDRALGIPDATAGGVTTTSSQRLRTTLDARASSAVDGDPATAWTTDFGDPTDQWIETALPTPATFDHLDLQVVADGRHSTPARLTVTAGGESRTVEVPEIPAGASAGGPATVPVSFAPLTGDRVRVTIDAVRPANATEYYSNQPQVLPVAIAELGVPGVRRAPAPSDVPSACRTDLITVDGGAFPVRLVGDGATAERGGPLQLVACTPDGIRLTRGNHEVRSTPGAQTGIDVDGLVLGSAPGGGAVALDATAAAALEQPTHPVPRLRVTDDGRTRITSRVRGATAPFWLVLGQSYNVGWRASVDGKDLGPPVLIDGLANGWRVDPGGKRQLSVTMTWTPQLRVWIALGVSALAALACVVILVVTRRRRFGRGTDAPPPAPGSPFEFPNGSPSVRVAMGATAAVAVGTAVFVSPWIGAAVGIATIAVLRRRRLRPVLSLGAPLALTTAAVYVIVQQTRYDYPPLFEWPTYFDAVHVVGWLAVALLAADAVCEIVSGRTAPTVSASAGPRPASPGTSTEPDRVG